MDLESIYNTIGGDYSSVASRLISEERIEKYLLLFLQDTVMGDLERTYAEDSYDEMFRAAHTMKGNSDTLGLSALHDSSVTLTEALRAKDYSNLEQQLADVRRDYKAIEDAVEASK